MESGVSEPAIWYGVQVITAGVAACMMGGIQLFTMLPYLFYRTGGGELYGVQETSLPVVRRNL